MRLLQPLRLLAADSSFGPSAAAELLPAEVKPRQ
jgi:hypothetical protein